MNRFWRFMLVFLPSSIIVGLLLRVPNIFGIIWWPLQVGWTYVVTAIFSHIWTFIILAVVIAFLLGFPLTGWIIRAIWKGAKTIVTRGWKSRKSKKGMSALRQALTGRFRRLIRNKIFVKLDNLRATTGIYKKAWTKRRIPPDYLPTILRENIIILYSISNYLKRLYVWYVKFDQVKNAEHICKTMWKFIGPLYTDPKKLEQEIYVCRNGGIINTPNGAINVGWFDATKRYCEVLNRTSDSLTQYVKDIASGRKGAEDYVGRIQNIRTELATALSDLKRSHLHLTERGKAYGDHQPIKVQKYLVLDQCNPYGWHEHQYKFVQAGTRLIVPKGAKWNISRNTRLPDGSFARRDLTIAPMDLEVLAPKDLEVNHYGDVLEDIYANTDKWYNPADPKKVPRRVHPDEIRDGKIKDLAPPEEIMEQIIKDWDGFIKNMRFGMFRPNSKSALDYIKYLSTNPEDPEILGRTEFFQEDNIKFTPVFKSDRNPAFDRRLLFANTGILKYVGRKGFMDNYMDIKNNPKTDPYPAVSSYGMSMYLRRLVGRDTEDIAAVNEFLKIFVRDTGAEVQSAKEAHKAMGPLNTGTEEDRN